MELSTPVVVQHHIHLTLTLDFQGQLLKMLYLRNGRADWLGTKGMWVDGMLDSHCDFELWPHPWPWPPGLDLGFSRSIFEIAVSQERGGWGDQQGTKGIWVDRMLYLLCGLGPWLWPWILKVKLKKTNSIIGIRGWIAMEPKRFESIGCWA